MKKLKLISLILAVIMVASMLPFAGMLTAFAEEQQPEAEQGWYERETTDSTPYELEINNVDDLFAYVAKLNEGTSTAPAFLIREDDPANPGKKIEKQLTVKLNVDIFLNDGWDALNVTKSEDVKVPAVAYPVKSAAYFAGIFDGQGHVLSGLYVNTNAQYTSLFGNVGEGYTATVKNVIILNSFIQGSTNGIGSIYGQIADNAWQTDHARNGLPTRGYIENVYVEASVSGTGQGRSNLGVGGLVGGSRAGLTVTNCAFIGNVFGGPRGAAAFCGQTRGKEQAGTNGNYYPSRVDVVVDGLYTQAHVVGSNYTEFPNEPQSGVAGLVGYANNGNEHFTFNNIICNNTFGTEQLDADGNEVLFKSESKDTAGNVVDSHDGHYYRTGYLYGFNFSGTAKSNDVPDKLADGTANPAKVMEPQVWTYNDVYYVKTSNKIKYQTAVFTLQTTAKYTINGTYMDWSFDKDTGVGALFSFPNYDPAKALKDMETDVAEIGYHGVPRTNMAGKQLYAHGGEYQSQLLMNKFNNECSLTLTDAADWDATLADKAKLTGWAVWNDMPLPQALIDMVDNNEAAEKQGETPAPDANWYENETTDATPNELTIYNANDLLAFAAAINGDTNFAGKTVKLAVSITLNEGWDAFAETVTAPATVWPLTTNNKSFAGTFDGNGKTISGIYLKAAGEGVGIFGNVATGTTGTVKNVQILNSYVEGNDNGTGGIFGEVDNETIAAKITDATYVNKTKAIVDNVYANINVLSTGNGNTNLGVGGIIGGSRTDVEITNTVFDGKVVGGPRGIAAFVGAIRPFQNGDNYYLNTITIKNSFAKATLEGKNSNQQSFVGGAVGYSNSNTTTHVLENVILDCVVLGDLYLGGIYGGAWCSANTGRDGVTSDAQTWDLTNVSFTLPTGTEATEAMADTNGRNASTIKINGTVVEGDKAAKAAALNALKTTDVAATAKTLEGWTLANGAPLPTTVYNSFYVGLVGQTVTLSKDLGLSIYIKTDGSASVYTGEFLFADAEEAVEVTSEAMGNNVVKFTLTGIKPYQMGETVTFTTEGYEVVTSVKDYAVALLADDATLAAALLRWGAAAQTVAEYNTDALVTDGVELPAATDTTAGLVNDAALSGTASTEYYFKGIRMYVEDGVLKIEAKVFMKDVSKRQGIEIKIDGRADTYLDYQEITIFETENRTYTAVFSNVDISNMNDDIVLTMLESNGGNVLSQTYTVDMDDLVALYLASSAADADKALVKAMHAVGAALAE